jgi:hypothetical protein
MLMHEMWYTIYEDDLCACYSRKAVLNVDLHASFDNSNTGQESARNTGS